jgi:hypothetical protein
MPLGSRPLIEEAEKMATENRPDRTDQPKRQPEPDREGQRSGGKDAGEKGRDWPADKETGPARQGEKRK